MSGKSFTEMLNDEPSEETEVEQAGEAPEKATETEEEQPKEDARPRDESGRFAKKGEEEGGSPPPDDQEFDGKATIGERRRRQEAEARLAELEQELQRLKTPQQQQEPPPDWFADPEAREKHLTVQFQEALYQRDLSNSERFARLQHGDEIVETAMEWGRQRCGSDPYFNQKVATSGDPVGYAVKEYQRDQLVNNVKPEDYAEFQKWREAQGNPQVNPVQPKPPPTITGERNVAKRSEAPFAPSTFKEMLGGR